MCEVTGRKVPVRCLFSSQPATSTAAGLLIGQVDGCENSPAKANLMNNAGPAAVAAAARRIGAKTVWYSTDYVFDGGVKKVHPIAMYTYMRT